MPKIQRIEAKKPILVQRKRVAAYARVSVDTEQLMHSLSAQISYYSTLIQGNPEWEYAGVYADAGISGTDTRLRQRFQDLIADCEDGKIDIVLTKSISRFARNTVDLLATVRHLKELGVEVRFEREHVNTFTGNGLFMEGYSYNRIAKILTDEGIPSPRNKGRWNDVCVASILTNETYMGDKILQKTYTLDFLHKNPIKNTGQVPMYHIEQDHEAIIDPDAFRRVQDEILRRKNKPCRGMTIFSGRIFCAECGASFGPKVWHSNDQYRRVIWQCNNKYKGTKVCRMPHLYEDGLQEEFLKLCNKVVSNREREIADLRVLLAVIGGTEELETKKAGLEAERDALAERLQALIDQNSKVAMNQEAYILQYDELASQYTAADKKVKEMEQAILEKEMRKRQVTDFITTLEAMPSTVTEFRPELWASLVDKVTVHGKNDVSFTLNSGAEVSP